MEFVQVFQEAVEKLVEDGKIPPCEWVPWEFLTPKVAEWGDYCCFTVLRTCCRLAKIGIDCDAQKWCEMIVSVVKDELGVKRVYAENGIINLQMFHLDSQVNVEKESKGQTFSFEPIGWVSSCFCEKFGTPRQSLYSKFSRGIVHLNNFINIDSFDGIQEFSHIWLVFVFHKSKHSKFKTKIKPPRLPGEKRGIFATRAPHRYNPIGLSLVKLEKVENREIWVSGIDLIDKTPILDIKPYHPVDSLSNFQCPEYINNPLFIYKVEFHPYSLARIQDIKSRFSLQFYQNDEDWEEVIREILAQDPSTVHTKTKHPVCVIKDLGLYGFKIDRIFVVYVRNSKESTHLVVNVLHQDESDLHDLRSEGWLLAMQSELTALGILSE